VTFDDEQIPLEAVLSQEAFVLLDLDYRLLSEHANEAEACRALAELVRHTEDADAAIYQRGRNGWTLY
jgi:hypothetical protein